MDDADIVDTDALRAYLTAELGPAESVDLRRHREGHSNETLFLDWDGRELVVRRPPPGETAEKAHDVLREYRVIDALADGDVPVPAAVCACEDESVIGCEFYVMERVRGTVLREEPGRFASPDHRGRLADELLDVLAAIHTVDVEAVGLAEFGYPDGFAERQVRRWSEQLTWAFETTAEEREVEALYDVLGWLTEQAPDEHPHALVHGDYKPDNVVVAPADEPTVAGVLDWELATLGDPRTDLGWLLSFWRHPEDPPPAVENLSSRFTERAGYPTRRELVDRWEAATGLAYDHDRFYRTLAVFKLAALGEMFFARYLQGTTDNPLYPRMREAVPRLAERAKRIVDGEEPL